jgi:aminoglycoside 6'-N-acetyltransferase I
MKSLEIVDVTLENAHTIEQIAQLLMVSFRDVSPTSWPTIEAAINEVRDSLQAHRISRIAVDQEGEVVGWIGGIEQYSGNVWELHPLVVRFDCRRQGLGRRLVADFERQVAQRGGHTVRLGTDDENCGTTLGGIDLYPGVLEQLRTIESRGPHPFKFWLRVGFHIVGVIPDANGFGKPDILMAKRIAGDSRGSSTKPQ